jgi:RNA polymerase sigma-B factor
MAVETTAATAEDQDATPRWNERERWAQAKLLQLPDLDPSARHMAEETIVLAHLDLVDGLVHRLAPRYRDQCDLRQVGYIGLMKAVRRFDPSRATAFLAFAVPTITGEIKRYLRDQGWTVRPPRRTQELRLAVAVAVPELYQELQREPSTTDVAARLEVAPAAVAEAIGSVTSLRPLSLEAPLSDGDATLGSLLPSIDQRLEQSDDRLRVRRLLSRLTPRERRILYLRFFEERTQREIADDLGVTQMQVSRLLTGILGRLRARLADSAAMDAAADAPQRRTA